MPRPSILTGQKHARRTRDAQTPVVRGARPARFPAFIEPCHPTDRDEAPSGDEWMHEVKHDGYRSQVHVRDGKVRIYTRRGHDWTHRYRAMAAALARLPVKEAIIDGEIVLPDTRGISDYAALRQALAGKGSDELLLYAFDLLYLDGCDLRSAKLEDRKALLARILAQGALPQVQLSEDIEADGPTLFQHACKMGLEGIVSKRRDAPYRSGRTESWLKVKCVKSGTFPIVAFVEKLGAKPRRIASLYLGRREGDRLLYAGKAQSGYTLSIAQEVRETLDPFVTKKSPLSVPVHKPKATWLRPVVEAEVEYSALTEDGVLREPVFKGIRDDLSVAGSLPTARGPSPSKRPARPGKAPRLGVPAANILQLLPDAVVPAKEQLKQYWRKVGPEALAYLGRRLLKVVRHVHGTTFYHRGRWPPLAQAINQMRIEKREGGEGVRLWIDSVEGLLALVDIGVVEIHPWNSRVDDYEAPDQIIFDVDPGRTVPFEFVTETALRLRELLREEGLESWPKLSGGRGFHVVAPATPGMTHDAARQYCLSLAQRLAKTNPDKYTISKVPAPDRVFIDYLRNGRGNTAIGAYSPRAREGFPIAAPVAWVDVENGIRPNRITMQNVSVRAKSRRRVQ